MNYIIGSIKHKLSKDIKVWVNSAVSNTNSKVVLLVLDAIIPKCIKELEYYGVEVCHYPTNDTNDVNICKWERHIKVRDYLKKLKEDDIVLLTDTLDVFFQKDPFEWFIKNSKKDLVLTSEGIAHNNEPWNMRSILEDHNEFSNEIENKEVINSGIILGKPKIVSDILLYIYMATKGLNPQSADQPAMNVLIQSSLIQDNCQIVNSNDNFVVHCAVAGPTDQFIAWGFKNNYKYGIPILKNSEIINSLTNEVFCLVHQYNRVREWDSFFIEKFTNIILDKKNIDNKTALVLCTKSNSSYHNDWNTQFKFNSDDYMLVDLGSDYPLPHWAFSKYRPDNVISYNESDIRRNLNFDQELIKGHWWNIDGGRNIIWFYPHFRMMYFYLQNPNYDYYWFFDDDVTFPNNDLYDFVDKHKSLNHDCMISYIFGDSNTEKSDILTMDDKMVSYHSLEHNWLVHYPGLGDKQPNDIVEIYGSYFPLVRFSNKALKKLVDEHNRGFHGYSEGYVPTILNYNGLSLYSIYNKNSEVKVDKDLMVYHRRYHQMKWENL